MNPMNHLKFCCHESVNFSWLKVPTKFKSDQYMPNKSKYACKSQHCWVRLPRTNISSPQQSLAWLKDHNTMPLEPPFQKDRKEKCKNYRVRCVCLCVFGKMSLFCFFLQTLNHCRSSIFLFGFLHIGFVWKYFTPKQKEKLKFWEEIKIFFSRD